VTIMSPWQILILSIFTWVGVVALFRLVVLPKLRAVPPGGDPVHGLMWYGIRVYSRLFHRARYEGQEQLRRKTDPGGMIVVANHTSGVDPLLIQSACHFHIRWMMAADMMIPELDWVLTSTNIIPVARDGRDSSSAREAIRHIRSGGVVGIFPEGRIVTHGEIRPFHTGVGLIAAKTQAPVLLVWISGTPETDSMPRSFITPSHARVVFAELTRFKTRDPKEITQQVREKLADMSGWPINDEPMPMLRVMAGRSTDRTARETIDRAACSPMRLTA
jgi:1-acyl-sn-glycerol-3-phosphate acyltransferase